MVGARNWESTATCETLHMTPPFLGVWLVALQNPQQEPWRQVATAILPHESLQLRAQRSLQRCNRHRQFVCRGMFQQHHCHNIVRFHMSLWTPTPRVLVSTSTAQHTGAWVGVAVYVAASVKIVVPNASNVFLRPQSCSPSMVHCQ